MQKEPACELVISAMHSGTHPLTEQSTLMSTVEFCFSPLTVVVNFLNIRDTECYFDTYASVNATQPPPEPPDLLLTKMVPLWSTWAMYRAESEDDCTTHGDHTSAPPAGDGSPVTNVLSVHADGILTEEKKSTMTMRPTRQKLPTKYFLTSASAKVGLSVTGDTESPTCP